MKDALSKHTRAKTAVIMDARKLLVGWQEWCALPALYLPAIKAKIDTGAKTSALHAFNVVPFLYHGARHIAFEIHPLQYNDRVVITCEAPLVDRRIIMNSGGHRERRYVIQTPIQLGDHEWPIEITLTNRDSMRFRMLLGRDALCNHALIDPAQKLVQPHHNRKMLKAFYAHTQKPHKPQP